MIGIKRISTKDQPLYDYIEQLLVASFPVEEYRDLSVFKEYTDIIPHFYCNVILDYSTPIGLFTYWNLGSFYYVEHFAIAPNQRDNGYGRKLLEYITGVLNKPIALEVERPTEEISRRRIQFYQRQGFVLWENEYFQPPYKPGYTDLPMYLMVKGELSPENDFETIKTLIHREIYQAGKFR